MTLYIDIVGDAVMSTNGGYIWIPNWLGIGLFISVFLVGLFIGVLFRRPHKTSSGGKGK